MYYFVVMPLFGNFFPTLSADFASCSTAKPSDDYNERIIHVGLFPPLPGVQQLGHLTSKDEFRSEKIAIIHAEEEKILVSSCSGIPSVVFAVVCEKKKCKLSL
jgi:hypothetical protein